MNCAESLAELQWHGVPVAGQHAGTRLARRLRLWARGRGASGGSVDDAAASGEGLHRWHRQGGCNSCQLVPISGLFSRASGDLVTALAARQPWCCPCLRIKPEAAGTYPARLQACRAWGLAAAQRLLGRAAVSLNAAMLAMLASTTLA